MTDERSDLPLRNQLGSLSTGVAGHPVSRREVLRGLGIGAGAASSVWWLAACGGGDTAAQRSGGAAKRGGTLLVGAGQDGYEQKPDTENRVGQYPLNANIFETLTGMTATYQVVPGLATKWELRPPNTWRFTLRRGVRFQDGTRFTADAVKYTFDRIADIGGGATAGLEKGGTKVVDAHTVDVTPKFANKQLPLQIVHPQYGILAPGSVPSKKPVGTGPFEFVGYQPDRQITVRRFAAYWGEKALLDEITFRFLPEANSRRLALQAGEVQLIFDAPREAAESLESKGFRVETSPVGAYEACYQNISGKAGYTILQDGDVRHAVEYAIDRSTLVDGVLLGLAAKEQTMIPSRLLGEAASKIQGYTYDPGRARRLLDKAGWAPGGDGIRAKDGQPLRLELVNGFPSAKVHGDIPVFLQGQLKKVGIDVRIVKTADTSAYTARLNSGQGDLWLEQGSQNDANPAFLPALLFWEEGIFGPTDYQPLFSPGWPSGPKERVGGRFGDLIEKALASPDPKEVKAFTAEAMHVLIDRDAIVAPLAGMINIDAMTDSVRNYQPPPSRLQTRFNRVALS